MPRRIETICNDCADGDTPVMHGELVWKGRRPYKVCRECGTVVDGTPGVLSLLYRCWSGKWPWQ